ncbi:MAG: poly-gamma-glutamate biosynthesis protein PgsC/CapC [Lachnospiraceae bacterium]|nr:poly-gamma-glutamate biosynthesis protein PgsC/CapC [Lachnospiraceae bacterium]
MYSEIVIVGILIAVLYSEVTGLSTGGLVAPVYFALSLTDPWRIVYTLGIILAVWGLDKLLGRYLILYGRRLFAVNVVLSFLLTWLIGLTGLLPLGIRLIGYIVPALLVRDLERQGPVKTAISLTTVTALCALCLLWVGML